MANGLLTDLDELVMSVRDPTSRAHIAESAAAYRGGAFRAAIVAAWVAVACDIISKIRELAEEGDANGMRFVECLNGAIASAQLGPLQKIEGSLLTRAKDEFQFLTDHEHEDLLRLKHDRDLCAHPALVTDEALFQPSPELVRAHLVHSVVHLLRHRPVQGKAALARAVADIASSTFPSDQDGARAFLKHRYLDRAKDSLVRNLVVRLAKSALRGDDPDLQGHDAAVVNTLLAVAQTHSAIYEATMRDVLPKPAKGLDDDMLWRAFGLIGADPRWWEWLGVDTQLRLRELVGSTTDLPRLATSLSHDLFYALSFVPLRADLLSLFERLPPSDQMYFIARSPQPAFANTAVRLFSSSPDFRAAEAIGYRAVLPMAQHFTADEVARLLAAVRENAQIRYAGEMPEILGQLFDSTVDRLDHTKDAWISITKELLEVPAAALLPDYTGLRSRLEGRGHKVVLRDS